MSPTKDDDAAGRLPVSRELGTTGLLVHPVALDATVFGWALGVDGTERVLDSFADAGGTLISTTDQASGGRSEVMIGSWLRGRDRSKIVLSTMVGQHPDAKGLGERSILRAVESSLDRLGTDHIDVLGFDGDELGRHLDDSLEAADRLVRSGKVRFIAASGFPLGRIEEVARRSAEAGYPDFRALFTEYSLMQRRPYETELQQVAVRQGRAAIAQLPLAGGYLRGGFRTRDTVPDGVLYSDALRHVGRQGSRVLDLLQEIAKEVGCTAGQVALAWVLLKPGIAAAAVRVREGTELIDIMGAVRVSLGRQHLAALDRVSAP